MRVLIADKFEQSGLDRMKDIGCRVSFEPDLSADALPEAIGDHEVLVVRSTKVQAPVFERGSKLSLVIRAGAGYDTIDVPTASRLGVFVANCPGRNSIAVAELTWGLILACDRRIPHQTMDLRNGAWDKKEYSKARGIYGRTLGIIGVGMIAREVIRRARAFGTPLVAWSRSLTDDEAESLGARRCASPIEVARKADIVSLHVASTPETKHLVDAGFLDAMKPGAFLINTTRGAVVDEEALLKAMDEKNIRVGLDVYEREPASGDKSFDSPVARHPNCVGTHHIGASTDQAQQAIADEAVRILRTYKETGEVPNCINRCAKSGATRLLTVRHLNRPGVLAHVIGEIGKAEINIEEMENVIFDGAEAACARIQLDSEPDPGTIEKISDVSRHILSVDLTVIE